MRVVNIILLDDSKFFQWFSKLYNIWKDVIIKYSCTSIIVRSIQEVKKELYSFPVQTVSLIVVIMVSLNFFSTILLKKEIELFSCFLNLLFLFIGSAGLFCKATWQDVKKTSFVLRQGDKYCRL